MDWRFGIVYMPIPLKLIYRFSAINKNPNKFPFPVFASSQSDPKCHVEMQKAKTSQGNLKK